MWVDDNFPVPKVQSIELPHIGDIPIAKGEFHDLPENVQRFVGKWIEICHPRGLFICDGGREEADLITQKLLERGTLSRLTAYENNFICRTDPRDVARVESKTFICTKEKFRTVPHVHEGVQGTLGRWISPEDMETHSQERFPGCMAGRMMYVIPYSMGPIGSPLAKYGVQLTDSNYVVLCMRIMTRVSPEVFKIIKEKKEFVRCVHSVGLPRPHKEKVVNHWPCNPEKTMIAHIPDRRLILSFGSGYGGNSLLGKKCFALRIASCIAYDEGWMAEHMLVMSITNPAKEEKFLCAAFPSACGKTNMAMLKPSLPGWKIQVVGDDIAWMRFDEEGVLRAINPEYGFFGVAPGTNNKTNPNAMASCMKNSIFTNVAETDDGRFFWEGLEEEYGPNVKVTTWLGEKTTVGATTQTAKAHPNSRFCCPASQCPIIHPLWEDPKGVPVSALMFGGRRPVGIPLVYEAYSWAHGVMIGAQVKSEATAAAEFKGRQVMHDPMAMRPFLGYNFGKYLEHWLSLEKPGRKMPKIFHVNWFRLDKCGRFAWPGFGDNVRVIDWALRRCDGEDIAVKSPLGYLPVEGSLNLSGLNVDWEAMFSLPKEYLLEDIEETLHFLDDQVGIDLPAVIKKELDDQLHRIQKM
ncbi:unnamed protein product [Dibothriocephalus latus]|uniref:phosphoenolpyruvate carboxykinase (GTP) n=1 Tax=Dibothriocephalus latus TaxID=60516 RepID=A0A3P7LGN6_DIBLA|nr:unnamed protein product [Dibothriocephalus latus]